MTNRVNAHIDPSEWDYAIKALQKYFAKESIGPKTLKPSSLYDWIKITLFGVLALGEVIAFALSRSYTRVAFALILICAVLVVLLALCEIVVNAIRGWEHFATPTKSALRYFESESGRFTSLYNELSKVEKATVGILRRFLVAEQQRQQRVHRFTWGALGTIGLVPFALSIFTSGKADPTNALLNNFPSSLKFDAALALLFLAILGSGSNIINALSFDRAIAIMEVAEGEDAPSSKSLDDCTSDFVGTPESSIEAAS